MKIIDYCEVAHSTHVLYIAKLENGDNITVRRPRYPNTIPKPGYRWHDSTYYVTLFGAKHRVKNKKPYLHHFPEARDIVWESQENDKWTNKDTEDAMVFGLVNHLTEFAKNEDALTLRDVVVSNKKVQHSISKTTDILMKNTFDKGFSIENVVDFTKTLREEMEKWKKKNAT